MIVGDENDDPAGENGDETLPEVVAPAPEASVTEIAGDDQEIAAILAEIEAQEPEAALAVATNNRLADPQQDEDKVVFDTALVQGEDSMMIPIGTPSSVPPADDFDDEDADEPAVQAPGTQETGHERMNGSPVPAPFALASPPSMPALRGDAGGATTTAMVPVSTALGGSSEVMLEASSQEADSMTIRAAAVGSTGAKPNVLLEMTTHKGESTTMRASTAPPSAAPAGPDVMLETLSDEQMPEATTMRAAVGDSAGTPDVVLEASTQQQESLVFRATSGAGKPGVTLEMSNHKGRATTIRAAVGNTRSTPDVVLEMTRSLSEQEVGDEAGQWKNQLSLTMARDEGGEQTP